MYFENTGIENQKADIVVLNDIMRSEGLVCSTAWDYERITWDRKFVVPEGTYYLRVFGITDGDIGANKAIITLFKPVLGKYYFPHGVEYGDDELWPPTVVDHCNKILKELNAKIQPFEINAQ